MRISTDYAYDLSKRILEASDAELIVGSVDPDFKQEGSEESIEPFAEIHREDPLPEDSHATIKIGKKSITTEENLRLDISKLMGNEDLSKYPSYVRLSKIKARALASCCFSISNKIELSQYLPGEEGFINHLLNPLSHFAGILTTYITRGFTDFKRSELTEYVQSNRFTAYEVFRIKSSDQAIQKLVLEMPKEMVGRNLHEIYVDIEPFLKQANIVDRINVAIRLIDNLIDDPTISIPSSPNSDILSLAKQATKRLGKNQRTTDTFGSIYGNGSALEKTVNELRDADAYLFGISTIHGRLKDLDAKLAKLASSSNSDIVGINALVLMLKEYADLVSDYGTVVTMLNTLQHHAVVHMVVLAQAIGA